MKTTTAICSCVSAVLLITFACNNGKNGPSENPASSTYHDNYPKDGTRSSDGMSNDTDHGRTTAGPDTSSNGSRHTH